MNALLRGTLVAAFLMSALGSAALAKRAPLPASSPLPTAAPSPTPRASTAARPGSAAFPPPVVVVFPLSVNGDAAKDAGSRMALLFATEFVQAGGLTIKPPPPGIERKDFLQTAQQMGADYYVSGYITPIGNEVSLVEQIVSTYTGIVVWSNTAQVLTYGDASGQAAAMRTALLRHAGRAVAQEEAVAQPNTSPSPQAQASGANLSLNKLFTKKPKASAAPAPAAGAASSAPASSAPRPLALTTPLPRATPVSHATPTPRAPVAAAAPAGATRVDLLRLSGSADDAQRAAAESSLVRALAQGGIAATLDGTNSLPEIPARFKRVCDRAGAQAIAHGSLALSPAARGSNADLDLTVYTCAGDVLYRGHVRAGDADPSRAIERAANEAVQDYGRPANRRKHASG